MSYFPSDIPFMSDGELKENDIYIPKDVSDTNVGKTKYFEDQTVFDALEKVAGFFPYKTPGNADTYTPYNEAWNDAIGRAEMEIETLLPAAVAPVVHSRWIKTADGAECEKCGREAVYQIIDDHWQYEPFCPHCGAKMDRKREEKAD